MQSLSELIDKAITNRVKRELAWDDNNPFEQLVSFGELVDRLTIVNIKLFNLKDAQQFGEDQKALAEMAKQDVCLVLERASLKICIDAKLLAIISRVNDGDHTGGFNPEVKKYG